MMTIYCLDKFKKKGTFFLIFSGIKQDMVGQFFSDPGRHKDPWLAKVQNSKLVGLYKPRTSAVISVVRAMERRTFFLMLE